MTAESLFVFALLAVTIVVFISDRFRMDGVALTVVVVLALSGVITPAEAVSGFSEPVVIMIAGLFVVGEGLFRTGVAARIGHWIMQVGGTSELRLLLLLLPVIALLSAFMSSTGAVALLIPVVMSIASQSSIDASRVLMPMAFAALIGGMLTLIGTPPNLIASQAMESAGLDGFRFFDLTLIGLSVLVVGGLYLMTIGRTLIPQRDHTGLDQKGDRLARFFERYQVDDVLFRIKIPADSPLVGQTVVGAALRSDFNVTVVGVLAAGQSRWGPLPLSINNRFQPDDTLYVYGTPDAVHQVSEHFDIKATRLSPRERIRIEQFFGAMELLVTPRSQLVGHTLKTLRFRGRYGVSVIGIQRHGEPIETDYSSTPLAAGDTLLVAGDWNSLRKLDGAQDFVRFNEPFEMQDAPTHGDRAPLAIGIVLVTVLMMTLGVLDNLVIILAAALLMLMSGCVTLREAYSSLNAQSLILIAGMLPLATAMDSSGAAELLINSVLLSFGEAHPLLLCAGLFLLTSVLSQFISNTATTVLMAPLALGIAQGMGLSPMPFLVSVAIAASTAFATPIASPVNTLVMSPGQYRFADFARVGIPLQLIALALTLALLPLLFPF